MKKVESIRKEAVVASDSTPEFVGTHPVTNKKAENLSQNSQYPGRHSNPVCPEYESKMILVYVHYFEKKIYNEAYEIILLSVPPTLSRSWNRRHLLGKDSVNISQRK
jgi:hypothetical protein